MGCFWASGPTFWGGGKNGLFWGFLGFLGGGGGEGPMRPRRTDLGYNPKGCIPKKPRLQLNIYIYIYIDTIQDTNRIMNKRTSKIIMNKSQ